MFQDSKLAQAVNQVTAAGAGNSRTAVCSTTCVPQGVRTLNAAYNGDVANAPSSGTTSQTVNVACTVRGG